MMYGVVKFFNTEKSFGFIAPNGGGADVFFHGSKVIGMNPTSNDHVEYEIAEGRKGSEAVNVQKVSETVE